MLNSAPFSMPASGDVYLAFGPLSRGRVWSGLWVCGQTSDSSAYTVAVRSSVGKPLVAANGFADSKPVSQSGTAGASADDLIMPSGRQVFVAVDAEMDVDAWLIVKITQASSVETKGFVSVQTGRGSEVPSENRSRTASSF